MQTARVGTIRFLRLLMVGSVALPVTLFAYAAWLNYNATFRFADERIDRSLTIAQENAANLFQSADLLLAAANALAGGRSDEEIRAHEKDVHDTLQRLAAPLQDIHSVWIFAADGRPLVSSNIYPVPQNFVNTDRDYFQAQVERDAGLYVGAVVPPKVAGPVIFSVSRRRPGDTFNGVVAVAIRPADTENFYQAIGMAPGSYYALLRNDGTFLARFPAPARLGLSLDKNSTTMKSIAVHPDSGISSLTSQTDAVKRRLGYRKLSGYPIYLLAGLDRDAILNEWLRLMASHLIFGVPATAIMFSAIFYAMIRTQRLYREAEKRATAEAALRQAQKMEAIGQLTGGVAHDFNNLLTIVIGNLDMAKRALERGVDGAIGRASQAVDNALQGARRAANLTQRLLAFSRQQPLAPAVLDLNTAIKDSLTLLRRALGENYELEVTYGAGAWNIEADPAQLDVTLVNLVVNARDAIEQGGKVTIETGNAYLDDNYCRAHPELKPGQYAMVAVSDTGSGMTADVLARAFEPFFTTKAAGRGTGLGLSQVYGFVKQSGGHVTMYSEPGQGTSVKMYFPRAYRAADQIDKPSQAKPLLGRGQSILVVEDDDDLRKYVTDTLRDLNYTVAEAANGEEALKAVEGDGKKFDALLTDVVMPGLNGRQLADRITAINPAVRVIFMTGYSRNAIIHHGRLDPGVKLLQKPFSRADLAEHIGGLWG